MKIGIFGAIAAAVAIAACSTDVTITAETTGTSSGTSSSSSSGTTNTQGSGGASTSSSSSSGGAGKLVAADTDMAQYTTLALAAADQGTEQKVVDGPFFVTDVFVAGTQGNITFDIVTGTDCSVPYDQHTTVMMVAPQVHGIRLPVLAGQALCAVSSFQGAGTKYTVLGFKPY